MNSPSRILVLGATGQVGAQLCVQLDAQQSYTALPAGRSLPTTDTTLHLDLSNLPTAHALDDLLAARNIAALICSAGATDVERCESDHAWAHAANHTGPAALAGAARRRGIPFVFFSTDYVFDGRGTPTHSAGPYPEDAPTHPLSVYGASKLAGEQAVRDAHSCALILRTTTVYGPDAQRKNFLYTLRRLLSEGKTMRLPTDQWANPTYNADLAAATLALLRAGASGLFHAAGPTFLPRTDFASLACRILHLDPTLIQPVTTAELSQKAARPLLAGLCSHKLTTTLGHNPFRSPEQGIRDWLATETTSA